MRINNKIRSYLFDKTRMRKWRNANHIPDYVNAAYAGTTGVKDRHFPVYITKYMVTPDITLDVIKYEEEILQELKDIRKQPFGYFKALWHMSQQLGTGEPWDSKFMPQFPGRTKEGLVQYAEYNNTIVSTNDLSNIIYGHICKFMGIPQFIAKMLAKLDACGMLELVSKGRLPDKNLLHFKDTKTDQLAITRGYQDFDIRHYKLL